MIQFSGTSFENNRLVLSKLAGIAYILIVNRTKAVLIASSLFAIHTCTNERSAKRWSNGELDESRRNLYKSKVFKSRPMFVIIRWGAVRTEMTRCRTHEGFCCGNSARMRGNFHGGSNNFRMINNCLRVHIIVKENHACGWWHSNIPVLSHQASTRSPLCTIWLYGICKIWMWRRRVGTSEREVSIHFPSWRFPHCFKAVIFVH